MAKLARGEVQPGVETCPFRSVSLDGRPRSNVAVISQAIQVVRQMRLRPDDVDACEVDERT